MFAPSLGQGETAAADYPAPAEGNVPSRLPGSSQFKGQDTRRREILRQSVLALRCGTRKAWKTSAMPLARQSRQGATAPKVWPGLKRACSASMGSTKAALGPTACAGNGRRAPGQTFWLWQHLPVRAPQQQKWSKGSHLRPAALTTSGRPRGCTPRRARRTGSGSCHYVPFGIVTA